MPLQQTPQFKPVADRSLQISAPASGGLNLYDLEYQQGANQTPYMLNMMYRSGTFGKRYGQAIYEDKMRYEFEEEIYDAFYYRDSLIIHVGNEIYKDDELIATDIPSQKGLFIPFNQNLYYICGDMYVFDGETFETVEPYIPTVVINRRPSPSDGAGDTSESYNMLGYGFENHFHGNGTATDYTLTDKNLTKKMPRVEITKDGEYIQCVYDETLTLANSFKCDYVNGKITFKTAPEEGINNVHVIAYKYDEEWFTWNERLLNSKYYVCFGGNNNSRLILAGNGDSILIYSDVYDASYFPYVNYMRVGNGAEDITGFGEQYNSLMVFKPSEIYALEYFIQSSSTTQSEDQFGLGAFSSKAVNSSIGCDCPYTIQLINSQLTWLSSKYGVCTLVSTNIEDERNVRQISRNINRGNNLGIKGLLDWDNIEDTISTDYDGKYFLANPASGDCFMWDYVMSPYYNSGKVENDANRLAWFLFDNIHAYQFIQILNKLMYIKDNIIVLFNSTYRDFDEPIEAYYMTPLFEFNNGSYELVDYLKTIKNVYVQCRGDHATVINMAYISEENPQGEEEHEPIIIYSKLWNTFGWNTFGYKPLNFAETFRRKCSIKKVQVMGIKFYNDTDADMSITNIVLQYQNVKNVK